MTAEDRYFVDDRIGCIAIRDRTKIDDPDYPGLHSDMPDVVEYAHGERVNKTCPTCGHITDSEWAMDEETKRRMHARCDKLNKEEREVKDGR